MDIKRGLSIVFKIQRKHGFFKYYKSVQCSLSICNDFIYILNDTYTPTIMRHLVLFNKKHSLTQWPFHLCLVANKGVIIHCVTLYYLCLLLESTHYHTQKRYLKKFKIREGSPLIKKKSRIFLCEVRESSSRSD